MLFRSGRRQLRSTGVGRTAAGAGQLAATPGRKRIAVRLDGRGIGEPTARSGRARRRRPLARAVTARRGRRVRSPGPTPRCACRATRGGIGTGRACCGADRCRAGATSARRHDRRHSADGTDTVTRPADGTGVDAHAHAHGNSRAGRHRPARRCISAPALATARGGQRGRCRGDAGGRARAPAPRTFASPAVAGRGPGAQPQRTRRPAMGRGPGGCGAPRRPTAGAADRGTAGESAPQRGAARSSRAALRPTGHPVEPAARRRCARCCGA